MLLEQRCHAHSCFLTLTYNEENLPKNAWLEPNHLKNFWKNLRRRIDPRKIKYFAVGEYGDPQEGERPHYHAALYGIHKLERKLIEDTWKKGFIYTHDLNHNTAQYMCKYTVKGWTFEDASGLRGRVPEFARMSKASGGIGAEYVRKMADKARKEKYNIEQIVRGFRINGKTYPLGRHLTTILARGIGKDDTDFETELWDYQQTLYDEAKREEAPSIRQYQVETNRPRIEKIKHVERRQPRRQKL